MTDLELKRNLELLRYHVDHLALDLSGLTVLTECASNAYSLTPVAAALAGARVYSVGKDSRYGSFDALSLGIQRMADHFEQLHGTIHFFKDVLPNERLAEVDIVTNSGALRPLLRPMIEQLNPEAVIALMWETWEFRDGEIDVAACQERGIPVIGTNEHFPKADMFPYPGMLALKLLFELEVEVANNTLVLLGDRLTIRLIYQTMKQLEVDCIWFSKHEESDDPGVMHYDQMTSFFEQAKRVDAIICADHFTDHCLIGKEGYTSFTHIQRYFPFLKFGHICGNIDTEELTQSGLQYLPTDIKPAGYMSYETIKLGWEPVLVLNVAGLKVGEIAARTRKNGKTAEEAIQATVDYGLGMDFEGGFFNFKK